MSVATIPSLICAFEQFLQPLVAAVRADHELDPVRLLAEAMIRLRACWAALQAMLASNRPGFSEGAARR
ncbi:MAG TPA: hypothetical protein VIY52_01325 [Streptosporangiaceae bacterium]